MAKLTNENLKQKVKELEEEVALLKRISELETELAKLRALERQKSLPYEKNTQNWPKITPYPNWGTGTNPNITLC